ncbi:hypothetical protein KC19_6G207100 [Ceratodon purpureus]|uniref:Uncharacterized protein n=1 Tax=Ceratodon purpureus TaxID=3225 RepID=A0A8T0HJR5_CERPU|nr:hypothetical protein KC19_6G207100 [Ceratodon purpureus]
MHICTATSTLFGTVFKRVLLLSSSYQTRHQPVPCGGCTHSFLGPFALHSLPEYNGISGGSLQCGLL